MEKLTHKSRFALILTILIAPFAGVSAAGLIDLNNNASAAADAALNTTVHGSASAAASTTNAASHADINAGINANANANLGSASSTHGGSNTGTSSSQGAAHANENALQNANENSSLIRITRSDAESADTTHMDMRAENVRSDADLKDFAATSLRNDDNLSAMGFANDRVEVAYKEPARFLGFIPVSVDVNVVAHNDGTVDIDYPWYSFLMLTHRSDIESAVKNEIGAYMSQMHASETALAHASGNSALNASTTATSTATSTVSGGSMPSSWSASIRAALAARIEAILRDHLSGTATSTVETY